MPVRAYSGRSAENTYFFLMKSPSAYGERTLSHDDKQLFVVFFCLPELIDMKFGQYVVSAKRCDMPYS